MSSPRAVPPGELHARTALLEPVPDLLRHLGHDGFAWFGPHGAFVTSGEAAHVAPAEAAALLAGIRSATPRDVPTGAGPIAVGALPFDGIGRLVVPARVVGIAPDGRAWRTRVGPADGVPGGDTADVRDAPAPGVTLIPDTAAWNAMVHHAVGRIHAGALEKVVLARQVLVTSDVAFDVTSVLERLRDTQPGCTVYADGGFVGASPEVLVRRFADTVTSIPMAGTVGRADAPDEDDDAVARLVRSEKDVFEHRLVVDAVREVLARECDELEEHGPVPVRLSTVTHLATTVSGRLRDRRVDAARLAAALHPTPAVGGTPRAAALSLLAQLEPEPRGRYGGPVGWVDARGDGEFVVALRCAALEGTTARLYAGAGIVADSDPGREWDETEAKLEPMLRALHPGAFVHQPTL